LAGILEKRQSLHKCLADQNQQIVQLRAQTGHIQALANIGMASAMIAHEINNILTPLVNYAHLSLNNPDDKELAQKTIRKTASNAARAAKILESMLAMADGKRQEKKPYNLSNLVNEIFTCIARDFSKDRINVKIQIPEDLMVLAEGISLQQVLMNLILNAREAMTERGGILKISARVDSDSIEIEIVDTGCGIEARETETIFKPFYTTKKKLKGSQRSGAGLGLAFCQKVIEAHKGRISVESKKDVGTTFKIVLPNN
jgi:two-component system NtrC family sensor kinase